MGYYTNYKLEVLNDNTGNITEDIVALYLRYNPFENECKWYEYDEDMRKVSTIFPDVIFVLHREGEEQGDMTKEYFKNGKHQSCEAIITFEEYDEEKLT